MSNFSHSSCVFEPPVGDVFVLAWPYKAAAFVGAVFVKAVKLPLPCAGCDPPNAPDNRNVSVDGATPVVVQPPEVFETETPKYSKMLPEFVSVIASVDTVVEL